MTTYAIISADVTQLEARVNERLKNGWCLCGGPVVVYDPIGGRTTGYQAMTFHEMDPSEGEP